MPGLVDALFQGLEQNLMLVEFVHVMAIDNICL